MCDDKLHVFSSACTLFSSDRDGWGKTSNNKNNNDNDVPATPLTPTMSGYLSIFYPQVGAVPSTVTKADIEMLATTFTPKEQEAVVNACTVMGFLNRFMSVQQHVFLLIVQSTPL